MEVAVTLWPAILLGSLALGAALAALVSLYWDMSLRDRMRISARFASEFSPEQPEPQREPLFRLSQPHDAKAADYPGLWHRFERVVAQSQVPLSPGKVLILSAGLAVTAGAAAGILIDPSIGALLALAGAGLPLVIVHRAYQSRLDRLLVQLPEALDLMARYLATGYSLPKALQTIAHEFEPPIAAEFSTCYEQVNLGLAIEIAIRELAERIGLVEYKILALALVVQNQTGGNLVPLLEKLARVVRDRLRLAGRLRAITAEGRSQAVVLTALPLLVFVALTVLNPEYLHPLFAYPLVLVGSLASLAIGGLWIRQIVHLNV